MKFDHKRSSQQEQVKHWRTTFASMLKSVGFYRDGTGGVFDPETETTTGGTAPIDITIKGMFRKINTDLTDGVNIVNTDSKFSVLQVDLVDNLGAPIIPLENDTITDHLSRKWRVLSILEDPTQVYWQLIIRRL